jgi:hypothetical protein
MKSTKVISGKNLPARLPIWPTITMYLLLDKAHPPQWALGAIALLWVIFWIIAIIAVTHQEPVDIVSVLGDEKKNK